MLPEGVICIAYIFQWGKAVTTPGGIEVMRWYLIACNDTKTNSSEVGKPTGLLMRNKLAMLVNTSPRSPAAGGCALRLTVAN